MRRAGVDQILLHPSDVVVSSIVCNPSIEAVVVPPVKTRLLTFEAMPPDKVRQARALPTRDPPADRVCACDGRGTRRLPSLGAERWKGTSTKSWLG